MTASFKFYITLLLSPLKSVFTACIDSLGHGANDVANSIAPLAAIYGIWRDNELKAKSSVDLWILAFGGVGIVLGLALYGYKIIENIGVELVKVTPSRGFTIELGAAFVIVGGSGLGIPLSTTHCQVGAEVGVGMMEGKGGVNWNHLGKIFFGWIITLAVTGGFTAMLYSMIVYGPSIHPYEGTRNMTCVKNESWTN